jgi:hypothetical protein
MARITSVALVMLAFGAVAAGAEEKGAAKEAAASFTLGLVQKQLRPGLSQAEVVEKLGAPNILTRDAAGRESWVYDKVGSEVELSSGGIGVGGFGSGVGNTFMGLLGVTAHKRSEKVRSTQRTLTVVVRFSAEGTVEGYTWHDSRF